MVAVEPHLEDPPPLFIFGSELGTALWSFLDRDQDTEECFSSLIKTVVQAQ